MLDASDSSELNCEDVRRARRGQKRRQLKAAHSNTCDLVL